MGRHSNTCVRVCVTIQPTTRARPSLPSEAQLYPPIAPRLGSTPRTVALLDFTCYTRLRVLVEEVLEEPAVTDDRNLRLRRRTYMAHTRYMCMHTVAAR